MAAAAQQHAKLIFLYRDIFMQHLGTTAPLGTDRSRRTSHSKPQRAYMGLPSSCGTPVSLIQGRTQCQAACAWSTSQHVQAWLPPGSRSRLLQVWLLHQPALDKRQRHLCELRATHQQACLVLRELKTTDHVAVRVYDLASLPREQQAGHGSCLHLGSSSSKLLMLHGRRRHHLHLQRRRRRLASRPGVLRHPSRSVAVQHAGGGVTNGQL